MKFVYLLTITPSDEYGDEDEVVVCATRERARECALKNIECRCGGDKARVDSQYGAVLDDTHPYIRITQEPVMY